MNGELEVKNGSRRWLIFVRAIAILFAAFFFPWAGWMSRAVLKIGDVVLKTSERVEYIKENQDEVKEWKDYHERVVHRK